MHGDITQPRVSTGAISYGSAQVDNRPSFDLPPRVGGLALAAIVRNISGAGATANVKLQHSPNPDSDNDAAATWIDVAGAAIGPITTNTALSVNIQIPHLRRVRWVITLTGTWTTGSVECVAQ